MKRFFRSNFTLNYSTQADAAQIAIPGTFLFDDAVKGADRVTEAVTLFALLELYKAGEAEWEQDAPFAPITVRGSA